VGRTPGDASTETGGERRSRELISVKKILNELSSDSILL
jgi:hypothetical protein